MWTLEEIREEYDRLDRYLGIDTSLIRLSFSKKMRRQHGVCCFRGDRRTEIRLADFLRAEDDAMLDTARHEYAHAAAALLTGRRHGHDAVWKDICVRIGCKPERLTGTTATEEDTNALRGALLSYNACVDKICYLRRGAVVRSIAQGRQDCRCRRCGGRTFTLERMRADGL